MGFSVDPVEYLGHEGLLKNWDFFDVNLSSHGSAAGKHHGSIKVAGLKHLLPNLLKLRDFVELLIVGHRDSILFFYILNQRK